MSKANIQNNDRDLATDPGEAGEVTLQAGVTRLATDVYGNKTEFRAVVLSPPIPLTATEVRLFYGDERLPANEKLQRDLATKSRFAFRARILDGDVPSPHKPLPDPCKLYSSVNAAVVNNLITAHTMFYSGEHSTDRVPSVGDVVKVLLEPGGQKYNLQYGHFIDIDDTVQRQRYLNIDDIECEKMAETFGNTALLGGNPSRKTPVEFLPEDPEPYLWKLENQDRKFEQIGAIYYGGRRDPSTVKFIVIHTTEGGWASTKTVFTEGDRTASAHYVLKENGDLVQMVPENVIAYHAAHGKWNAQSIGIEIIGFAKTSKDEWLEKAGGGDEDSAWFQSLLALLADICARYNINPGAQGLPGIAAATTEEIAEQTDSEGNKVYLNIKDNKLAYHMNSPGNGCGAKNALLRAQGRTIPADRAGCHWDPGPGFIEAFASTLITQIGNPANDDGPGLNIAWHARENKSLNNPSQPWPGLGGKKYNKPTSKTPRPQGPIGGSST